MKNISLDEIHQKIRAQKVCNMSVYVDSGEGFSEEGKLYQDVDIVDGAFSVTFTDERLKDAKRLRFDPIEGRICVAKIDKLSEGLKLVDDNSRETSEEGNLFINLDPQFYIEVLSECGSVSIKGSLMLLKEDEIIKWIQKMDERHVQEVGIYQEKNTKLEQENVKLSEENERNAYYANSTKAFIKRKIQLKLGKIKE